MKKEIYVKLLSEPLEGLYHPQENKDIKVEEELKEENLIKQKEG